MLKDAGLRCFGKISASISHEIKNTLAIINENAGLLSDLAFAAEQKGMPLDPERIKSLSEKVAKQIRRSDGIVKNLNRFAHSVDEPVKTIDLWDTVVFAAALSGRFVANKGITLEMKPPESQIMVTTHPFFFINLICRCLDFAMDVSGPLKTIGIEPEKMNTGARIQFTQLNGFENNSVPEFPSAQEKAIMDWLNAELSIETEKKEIILTLP